MLRLPGPLPHEELLRLAGRLADNQGIRAFLVGGPVRDILLGRPLRPTSLRPDIDIAVEGTPETLGRELARRLNGRFVFHRRFLSGTVSWSGSTSDSSSSGHIDIGQTRVETYARPAALPDVRPAPIEQDLVRRDFTINAMALELSSRAFGRLLDPYSGRGDLASRLVRVLHAKSFVDDPTRAFRAIRFAARFRFRVEPETLRLMRASIRERCPSLLSPERVLYELRLIASEPSVLRTVSAMRRERLLESCFDRSPSPQLLPGLERMVAGKAGPELLYVFVLACLPTIEGFPITKAERAAAEAIKNFGRLRPRVARAGRPSAVYQLLHSLPGTALQVLRLVENSTVSARIAAHLDRYSRVKLAVTGRKLAALGFPPGPEYRSILDRLLAGRLDGRVKSDHAELELAEKLVRKAGKERGTISAGSA